MMTELTREPEDHADAPYSDEEAPSPGLSREVMALGSGVFGLGMSPTERAENARWLAEKNEVIMRLLDSDAADRAETVR